MKKNLFLSGVFGALLLAGAAGLRAQVTTATISGTVRDASGAAVPGAEIIVRNVETGVSRTLATDEQGRYTAPTLSLGRYETRAGATGFQTEVRTGITLTVGQHAVIDFTLSPGAVTESVTVTGEAPLVETTTSAMGALVDREKIRDLPLNGRDYTELTTLQPGVIQYREPVGRLNAGKGVRIAVAGARPNQVGWRLNGLDIADAMGATPGSVTGHNLGVDGIQEFQVLTNAFSAEYGKAAGGVVNVVHKSGTNSLHGSAFEYLRNDKLDARGFFDSKRPAFKRNQFGFSLGGPVRKDHTFFFGNYEGLRERLGFTSITNIINQGARNGNITIGGVPRTLTINPAVKPYLDILPLPNGAIFPAGVGQFIQSASRRSNEDYFVVKMDHTFSSSDSLSASYTSDDGRVFSPPLGTGFSEDGFTNLYQYVTLQETHIFSPTTLNTFRAGLNRSNPQGVSIPTGTLPESLYFVPGVPPGGGIEVGGGVGLISGATGSNVAQELLTAYEVADTLHLVRGAHTIKVGMNTQRFQYRHLNEGRLYGGRYTFASLADFLEGRASSFQATDPDAPKVADFRQRLFGFFAQDDLQLRPNLTVNAGLRYEFVTVPGLTQPFAGTLIHLTDPVLTTSRQYIADPSRRLFGPRVGLAWDLFGDQKTALRAGFGLYYDQITSYYMLPIAGSNPPFGLARAVLGNPPFPNAFALIKGGTLPSVFSLNLLEYNFTQPYRIQYNFGVQRELTAGTLLAVSYVGARGVHSTQVYQNANSRLPTQLPDGRLFFEPNAPTLNPNFGTFYYRRPGGDSYYSSFQLVLNRRPRAGLQYQASYTWSKSLDTGDVFSYSSEGNTTGGLQNWFEPGGERGLSAFDARHYFALTTTYDLPFGDQGKGARKMIAAGWQVGGILTFSSGQPFTLKLGFDNANMITRSVGDDQRPDLAPGRSNNPTTAQNPSPYFDPTAFRLPQRGTLGNLARNTLIGPGVAQLNFTVKKRFPVGETGRVEFRGDFFNLFNRVNFHAPATAERTLFDNRGNINPAAGRISEAFPARQIQLSLRWEF